MKPSNIKINYLKSPLNLGNNSPRINWSLDEFNIDYQKSFDFKYVLNESKEETIHVESSSMHFDFPFKLNSRDEVKFQIRIYDENDLVSEWSDGSFFKIGLLTKDDFKAKWIGGDYKVDKKKRYPVDCFKKEFTLDDFDKSYLYISAFGLYECYINDKKIGNYVLTPGSTDYKKRVQYDCYDVKDYLKKGKNTAIIYLADGWYRGSIGSKGFEYVFGKESKLFFQLELSKNNNYNYILSDESFKWSNDSSVRFSDLKDGEIIDNRMVPSFKSNCKVFDVSIIPTSSDNFYVKETGIFDPIEVNKLDSNTWVYKFEKNVAGYISFKAKLKDGDYIYIKLGELIDDSGHVTLKNVQCVRKNRLTPLQEIRFTAKDGLNEYKSKFFYGGFMYAEVVSPIKIDLKQVAISSLDDATSSFSCSNNLINIFYQNTINSIKSNSVDIPTDCPTRERMGWTGDSQIIFNTASYLFDYAPFALKHLRDVFDRQYKDGKLPQIAPYSAEDWFMDVMNGSVGWADVGVLIPYRFYKLYGDERILINNYDNMKRYTDFMIKRCGRAKGLYSLYAKPLHLSKENTKYQVNTGQSYGEWAEPKDVRPYSWTDFACPHPEESMAYTSYILSLMIEISEIINKKDDMDRYKEYRDGVKRAYQELVTKKDFSLDTDRQCKLVRPLYMNLLTDEQALFAKNRLLKALENYDYKLGTGFLSTPLILDVLSKIDKEKAYDLLLNEKMPGWLYMSINNTGTIWEGWEGPNSESGIASLNHYSKGAMVEWLFNGMCGINVIGENIFSINPIISKKVKKASARYKSIYGTIEMNFEIKDNDVTFNIAVPSNSTCKFIYGDKSIVLHHGLSSIKCKYNN